MLKQVLLASAIVVSTPALAQVQDVPLTTPDTVPTESGITPATPPQDTSAQPDVAVPADPSQATTPATPDQMTQATDPAQPADAQAAQPATADQVAQAVDQDFPTYDANGDGKLDETEFAAWMTALRTASDPNVQAGSPEMAEWAGQAFAAADTDKDAALSKGELTAFLSQGAS